MTPERLAEIEAITSDPKVHPVKMFPQAAVVELIDAVRKAQAQLDGIRSVFDKAYLLDGWFYDDGRPAITCPDHLYVDTDFAWDLLAALSGEAPIP